MIAVPIVPFRGPHFARELLLRKLEIEVRADRRPAHLVDVLSTLLSAPAALAQIINPLMEVRCALVASA